VLSEKRKNELAEEFSFNRYEETPSEVEWGILDKLDELAAFARRLANA
jgi:hypothetical protein